ncbi:MAG: NAD(P)-binding protein [candidate division WOR-3 bacterium]|nr:NAD(P)-binding protein [candidate division WOR-3 bacterium]
MKWLDFETIPKVILEREPDYPPWAVSLTNTLVNRTGSWRIFRPKYFDKTPPCNDACPAHEKIQGYMELVKQKKFLEGYELIIEDNPFPSITGRVCFHPCEASCNRGEYDESLGIHNVERFLGDYGLKRAKAKKSAAHISKQIAIIGSGPAGLTCAYYLAKSGYKVIVYEHFSLPGGMLRVGIPAYRLPKDILNKEIRKLEVLGVKFKTNFTLGKDIFLDDLKQTNDAVFIATGAHKSRNLGVPEEKTRGVYSGLEFLAQINSGKRPRIGKEILVIGGGNTAVDAARSALRLGILPKILYRRTRHEMPAVAEEVQEAENEGIPIHFLVAPVKVIKSKGRITRLECQKMKLGKPDESGRRRPVPIKGSNFRIKCDSVICAIGEQIDLSVLTDDIATTGWSISADDWGRTNLPNIFAGGDCVTGPKMVVDAIAAGKRTALAIDSYFTSREIKEEPNPEITLFSNLNIGYFELAQKVTMPGLNVKERKRNFREVHLGYNELMVYKEADRCFSCGVCNKCDNCFVFCPDLAVMKSDDKYDFDYDYCKGCGVCAYECPRNAISMEEEEAR